MRDTEREAVAQKRHQRIGEFLDAVAAGRGAEGCQAGVVTDIRIRLPTEEDPSTLLVVKVSSANGPMIAFVGAYSPGDAILAWRARCKTGSVKWKADVPWSERSGG